MLKADVDGFEVEGQVAVARARGRIRRVEVVPADARATPEAVAAIAAADQVVLGPGSLYTSVLAVLSVEGIRDAVRAAPGRVVQVGNLATQVPETAGLDAADHLAAILDHGGRVDVYLAPDKSALALDETRVRALGAEAVRASLCPLGALEHDPDRLARALVTLL